MPLLMPTISLDNVTDIDIRLIKSLNVDSVLLDVDDTLASHGSQEPFKGVLEWTYMLRAENIKIVIVSNNFKRRVAPFAEKFDLPYVSLALKPLPFGFNRAKRLIDSKSSNTMVVGDQVFTDVLGANLARMKSVLLVPRFEKATIGIHIKRKLEKRVRDRIKTNRA